MFKRGEFVWVAAPDDSGAHINGHINSRWELNGENVYTVEIESGEFHTFLKGVPEDKIRRNNCNVTYRIKSEFMEFNTLTEASAYLCANDKSGVITRYMDDMILSQYNYNNREKSLTRIYNN